MDEDIIRMCISDKLHLLKEENYKEEIVKGNLLPCNDLHH